MPPGNKPARAVLLSDYQNRIQRSRTNNVALRFVEVDVSNIDSRRGITRNSYAFWVCIDNINGRSVTVLHAVDTFTVNDIISLLKQYDSVKAAPDCRTCADRI